MTKDRLFIGVLGHQNSGKSETWNRLFGRTVRRGKDSRSLSVEAGECVDVFVVSGSFEERGEYAGDVLADKDARIILCSVQYNEESWATLEYARGSGFDVFIQWLNPGYSDQAMYFDWTGYSQRLLASEVTLSIRNGKLDPRRRVEEIRAFILGWARQRGLTYPCKD